MKRKNCKHQWFMVCGKHKGQSKYLYIHEKCQICTMERPIVIQKETQKYPIQIKE